MKDEKKIFSFESDSDDNQENKNEEENYSNHKKNSPCPSNDEKDKGSDEYLKLETLVNTLLNKKKKKYMSIYEVNYAFFIKNKDISANFEKSAKNEETLYGWFIPDENDEEIQAKRVFRLKEKGLEKIEQEIMVSPPEDYNIYDTLYSIIICRFILGKNVGLNREKELSEKEKEQYLKKNYDTVYRVNPNSHKLNPPKSYSILKKENIELLYYAILKEKIYE